MKQKAKKSKKGENIEKEDDDFHTCAPGLAPPQGSKGHSPLSPVFLAFNRVFQGSLFSEFKSPDAWTAPDDPEPRFAGIQGRLPWENPLGLNLDWHGFIAAEMDGGPQRTSKRGVSPGALRLQKNVPAFLAEYIVCLFGILLLFASSQMQWWFFVYVLQAVLINAPNVPQVPASMRILALQAVHCFFVALLHQTSLVAASLFEDSSNRCSLWPRVFGETS